MNREHETSRCAIIVIIIHITQTGIIAGIAQIVDRHRNFEFRAKLVTDLSGSDDITRLSNRTGCAKSRALGIKTAAET